MANTIVSAQYVSNVTVKEVISTDAPFAPSGSNAINHTGLNTTQTNTPTSTIPVSLNSQQNYALSSGALTVDLTSLLQAGGGSVSASGLKVRFLKIKNTGTAVQTYAQGGSNPWEGLGTTWSISLYPGDEATFLLGQNSSDPAVGSGAKTIAVTGTGADTFAMGVCAG